MITFDDVLAAEARIRPHLSPTPMRHYPLLDALVGTMQKASAEERSSDAGLAAWQFAENLTTLLPAAEGRARRAVLADLGVRMHPTPRLLAMARTGEPFTP